ncbi:ankyrin repeat domain-containing protein [Sphingobacterium siyangense]|uniref:Ankyrin repeat protein n=1 Tax=Sphingobacterium siyangense TaxID=459529 RepID=A0A562MG22_9SPHI|nr:ankyrin repeat domain-containing protein [Sphingobacterium siyangense]TWI18849.1 ankyrin repeat protein [Sphingobacterium siyangense]
MKKYISLFVLLLAVIQLHATPLCNAVKENNLTEAARLLENGANVNERNALGYTPLMLSAGLGNYQMTEMLLSAGADVNMLDTRMGSTALHKAAQSGVVPVADLLVKHGAYLDLTSPTNGNTPLYDAVWHRNAAMVKYLLEAGANWETKSRGVISPLLLAQNVGDKEIVSIIENHAKQAEAYIKNDKIFKAIDNNDVATIKKLIADGLDINEKAKFTVGNAPKGATPLLYASQLGKADVIKVLLEAGANPRITDWIMKSTVLHKSGYNGHAQNIKMLVEAGAELDAQGAYNGYTALHDAVWHGHYEAAQALLENGARYDLKGLDGNTPLDLAKKYGYTDIQKLLEQYSKK